MRIILKQVSKATRVYATGCTATHGISSGELS